MLSVHEIRSFLLKEHANGDRWEDISVAFNSRTTPARLEVPAGKYTVVCKDGVIDVRGLGTQTGPEVIVPEMCIRDRPSSELSGS